MVGAPFVSCSMTSHSVCLMPTMRKVPGDQDPSLSSCSCLDSALAFTPCLSEAHALRSTLPPPTHGRSTSPPQTRPLGVAPSTNGTRPPRLRWRVRRVGAGTGTWSTTKRNKCWGRRARGWLRIRSSSRRATLVRVVNTTVVVDKSDVLTTFFICVATFLLFDHFFIV